AELFPQGQTSSNSIQFMAEKTFTNAAAAVAEGNPKPESTLGYETKTSPTQKLAHFVPATTEMLEDFGNTEQTINGRLIAGIKLALDDALVNGSGVSPNLEGLLARVGLAAP